MIFFILILAIALASFTIILQQNRNLEQTTVQNRQMDLDRANEQLAIINPILQSPNTTSVSLSCVLNNTSPLVIQLVRLWVEDVTTQEYGNQALSIPLQQGESQSFTSTVNLANSAQDNFTFWFVTARGNKFTPQEPATTIQSMSDFNIGPFILIFSNDSFRFTADNYPPAPTNPAGSLPDISVPQTAYQIDNDNQRISFIIQIKDGDKQAIELSQESFFLVEVRNLASQGVPGTQEYERYFHLVSPSSAYNSLTAYSPDYSQVLPAGQISTLKFAAETVGGHTFLNPEGEYQPLQGDGDNGNNYTNLCWTFLVLFWRYQNSPYTYGTTIAYFAVQTLP
jgi:hypothetical protein